MQRVISVFIILATMVFSFAACGLFDNFDEVPMFLEMKDPGFSAQLDEGSSNHKILDIWPSADGKSLGVFEMPATIPVLDENQETNVVYFAGVHRNGSMNDHLLYPFYERVSVTHVFEPGAVRIDELNFRYREDVVFSLLEDFNANQTFTVDVDEDTDTFVDKTTTDCIEGQCGIITLRPDTEIEVASGTALTGLPNNGTPIYLELNYKNDVELRVGLQGDFNGNGVEQYLIILKPTNDWNKIYLDFSELVFLSDLGSFRVLFGARNDTDEDVNVMLDNVKLIHF